MHFLLLGYIIDPFNNCDVIDIILKYLKDLNELVIWNCDWNATSIGVDSWCLTETGRTQNTLKRLVLKQCALDTKDVVHFEEIVETFPNLEELQVDHFENARSYYYFQTENLEEDLDTLSLLRNLRIIKFTGLYKMGDSESRDDHGKGNSDDEEEDDNEVFFRELKMAQRTLRKQFHVDSEVEIDIAKPDDGPDGTALKAVLIKKKGFDPALLPPWISGNNVEQDDDNLLPGSRNRNRKSESSTSSSISSSTSSSSGSEAEIGLVTESD